MKTTLLHNGGFHFVKAYHSNFEKSLTSGYTGAIQVLHNAMGVGVVKFPEKSVTKVNGLTLLALQGGGRVSNFHTNVT